MSAPAKPQPPRLAYTNMYIYIPGIASARAAAAPEISIRSIDACVYACMYTCQYVMD